METLLVPHAVELFLAAVKPLVAPATFDLYNHYLRRFSEAYVKAPVMFCTPAILLAWSSKYHPLSCVQRLYRWLKAEALLIPTNPIEGMRKRRNLHRCRVLSRREQVLLMRAASPAFRLFILAMVESGARPHEVRRMDWRHVRCEGTRNWDQADLYYGRCYFLLQRFKGQSLRRNPETLRVIPISSRLGRSLNLLAREDILPQGEIFLNCKGRAWTHNAVRLQMRRLRAKIGLTADENGENVVCYSLRHTAATLFCKAGLKTLTLAELLGHSDVRMTQRYVHLCPDHLVKAAGQVYEWKQARKRKNDLPGSTRKRLD